MITRLEADTRKIKSLFAGLVINVVTALEESVTATSAKLKLLLIQVDRKDLADCINPDDSISMAMLNIGEREPWSFFDYKFLERVVNNFCANASIVQEFKGYKSHFRTYCERRLDEIPLDHKSLEHIHSESLICVKFDKKFFGKKVDIKLLSGSSTDDEEFPSLSVIKDLQYKLSEILGIGHLVLLNVEMGCIELTFRHFKDRNPLHLLEVEKKVVLAFIGIKKIQCGTESHDLQSYI